MNNKIDIKVVADLICPWCFIGCNHLNEAIKLRKDLTFEIDWQSFYLNPTIPTIGSERKKYLKNKFGNQVNMVETQIINVANSYGIEINLNKIQFTPNTRKIHQVINFFKQKNLNKSYDLAFEFMKDYFVKGEDLRNDQYIMKKCKQYDLSKNDEVFRSAKYFDEYQPFINFNFMNGVPVFIFNNKWTLTGAQAPKIIGTTIDIASKD